MTTTSRAVCGNRISMKSYVKAGIIVVDNKPYRITPLSP